MPLRILALFLSALLPALTAYGAPSAALENLLHQIFVELAFNAISPPQIDWLHNGTFYTTLEKSSDVPDAKDIVRYATVAGSREVLVAAQALIPKGEKKPLSLDGYRFSEDDRLLLIFTNSQRVWRQRTRGDYWLLDLSTKTLTKLGGNGEPSSMQFAAFSPDETAVAFVREHDLFVQNLADGKIRQLTHDGSHTIINGTSDWVYEEELGVRDAFRWSPDGQRIAFWHFDSSGVGEYPLIDYTDSLYPTIRMIPYPKVGTTNSAVSVGVVDVHSGKTKWMDVPGDPRNNYIARMEWAGNSNELVIEQLNRLQNTAHLFIAETSTGKTRQIFEDRDKAWVDVNEIRPLGNGFVWLSERDGWRHAYLIQRDGSEATLLTPGNFDVITLVGIAEKQRAIYFAASPENATQSYLYRVIAAPNPAAPVRITPASQPGFHRYFLAPGGEWALHSFSRFDDPGRYELVRLEDSQVIRTFIDNAELRKKLEPLLENQSEFLQVNIGNGITLDGWMIRPKNFDPSRKYPVLVQVYGEPAAQTVVDRWGGSTGLFHRALAQDGYIIVSFDNRGTPAPKGREWRKVVYGSLGPLMTEEQTKAIKALCAQHAYLDSGRIAVWGWSGGGNRHAQSHVPFARRL